ncbi:hypothetical protein LCGC14_0862770 [marine sediment metagenome]|uniref:Uncharacterized protein n=1 Tax=marine sediment metagenome TaxID=412755 RepID=A0A0F9P6W8_9ZZZZ|nr:hypothetical protein [Candidatus Scalindua sp.]HDZ27915.1 hypothetical protein [Candidatus Aminicenantes bacterium]
MKTKILRIYKDVCKINDDLIKKGGEIHPMCFLIKKNYNLTPIIFMFKDQDEKVEMRKQLKNFIVKQDICGYILIFDTKMTMIDKKGKKPPEVVDAIVRTLYTPGEKKMEMLTYKDKKIIKTIKLNKKDIKKTQDEWDLWGKGFDETTIKKGGFDYRKFKRENPELYDGVVDQFDDYTQFRDKQGNLVVAYKIDNNKKEFKYYVSDDAVGSEKDSIDAAFRKIMELNKFTLNYKMVKVTKK